MKVTITEVNEQNWYECCQLQLTEQQMEYMESNAISIAQTKFQPSLVAYAICLEEKVVGFTMYNSELEELDGYWIYRIMLDKSYQSKGIGKVAMKLVIDEISKLPIPHKIIVGYHPSNTGAQRLYESLGFIDEGNRFGREIAVIKYM